jgi:phage-related protein
MAMNVGQLVAYLTLDDAQFRRALAAAGRGAADLGKTALKAGAGIAAIGGSVQGIAGIAAVAGQAAGALGLLPAAAMAAKFGMVALQTATAGFGEAMAAMDDPAAFAAAIAELSPAAQDAAKAVRGLKPAWDAMADGVQERLFAGLADDIGALGQTYMPMLGASFGAIADSANTAAQRIGTMLQTGERQTQVNGMFTDFATIWDNIITAATPLVSVLLDVGSVGAKVLADVSGGAVFATAGFRNFITQAKESGQLEAWMRGGLDALRQIGEVGGNLGEIIGGVFRAASVDGGSLLSTLTATTQAIADMVNSVAGQTALSAFFQTAATLSATFMEVLGALLPAVAPLVSLIGQLAQVIGVGVGDALLAVMPALGTLVEALVGALQPVLPVLADAFGQIAAVLGPLAAIFADTLAPILPQVAELFTALVEAAMPLLPPIAELVGALLPVVGAILSNVVIPAIRLVIGVLAEWWKILATGIQLVADFVGGAVGFFTDLGGNVDRIIGDVGRWITNGLDTARRVGLEAISGLVSGAVGFFGDLLANVGRLPGQILSAVGNLGGLLVNAGMDVVRGLWNGIAGMGAWLYNQIMGWVRANVPGPVLQFLGIASPSKLFRDDIGRWIPEGLADGIIGNAKVAGDAARQLARDTAEGAQAGVGSSFTVSAGGASGGAAAGILGRAGAPVGAGAGFTVNVYNPSAERSSDAIVRAGSVLAALGPWGDE